MNDREIFAAAIKLTGDQRIAFLDSACGQNASLRKQVDELLSAHEDPAGPLPFEVEREIEATQARTVETGTSVGPFKLLQQIGEGGMGVVYMAEQKEPVQRRVALKIIKPGMDTRQVIARFEAERQALALMDHPNIAKVLDAGQTDTGQPFFVMELVNGLPVTEYCDEKRLTPTERLKLFIPICQAVQHAHQKGIIHRDLKPSNVLVALYDGQAVPKVIDFGVAKATNQVLTEKTLFTQFGQVVGTLEYMSPEQAERNQLNIDTRSDIYSLGVLLYQLLVGETPFDRGRLRSVAFHEMLRILREEDPPRPSTKLSASQSLPSIAANRRIDPAKLATTLRGDLDWIVMKTVEKDRSRRYQTANGLSADIERYLAGEPTVAAPPSVWYRTRKFAGRHRLGLTVSAALLLMMLVGIVGTTTGLAWALVEKDRADAAAIQAIRNGDAAENAKEEAIRNAAKAESARDDAEYAKYNANLQALFYLLDRQSSVLAASLLRTAPADHRNWEWAYQAFRTWPKKGSGRGGASLNTLPTDNGLETKEFWQQEHVRVARDFVSPEFAGGMFNGSFSKDGNHVFLGRHNGGVHMFSTRTGELVKEFPRAHGGILELGISPDESRVASFVFSGGAFIWDVGTGKIVNHHPFDLELESSWTCAWSNDQKLVISAHMGGNLRIWNSETLEEIKSSPLRGHRADVRHLYVPAVGNEVWSVSLDGTVRKWSLPDGELIDVRTCPVKQDVEFHCVDGLGKNALMLGRDGVSVIWDVDSEQVVARLRTPLNPHRIGDVRQAASFSPDGTCVVVMSGQHGAKLFDIAGEQVIAEIPRQRAELVALRFGPDGKTILTVSEDAKAKLWTCSSDPPNRLTYAHEDAIYQVDMDNEGKRLLTGSYDTTATIWDTKTWEQLVTYRHHDTQILAVDLSPDNTRAATLDATGKLHIWDPKTGAGICRIDSQSDQFARYIRRSGGGLRANVLHFPAVLSTGLFTPDGSRVVAYQGDSMKVYDAKSGKELVVLEGASKSGWPVYSFDSSLVAVLEMNSRTIRIWDLKTGECLRTLGRHRKGLVMVHFSPCDHRLVTASTDLSLRIWDAETGEELHVLGDASAHPSSCRFSADGKLIIAGYTDCIVRLWDSRSGRLIRRFSGHNNRLRDARLNPDGTRLLSWSVDDQAIVWDAKGPNSGPLVLFDGASRLIQARWTPDGRNILSFWSDGNIQVWQGASRDDLEEFRMNQDFTPAQLIDFRNRFHR